MLKLGVYTIESVRKSASVSRFLKIQRPISITLYEPAFHEPDAEALQEKILLPFSDGRGAYKRTYCQRFQDFDQQALQAITTFFPHSQHSLRLLDAGVSDARTAVDFFLHIHKHCKLELYEATDYDPEVFILKHKHVTVIFDRNAQPLEVLLKPFVFYPLQGVGYYYLINKAVWWYIKTCLLPEVVALFRKHPEQAHKVQLFCKPALDLQNHDPRFVLGRYNLLEIPQKKYHIFRAMNVLNVSYFSDAQMQTVIGNIFASLEDGGLFITGSNQDAGSVVNGGIYRKETKKFSLISSSGQGSPIQDKIQAFTA